MTSQQSIDVHPIVYQMNVLEQSEYPDVCQSMITMYDTDHNIAVVDNYNMYGVMNYDDTSIGNLCRLQRQDFHEHYFTALKATDSNQLDVSYGPTTTTLISSSVSYLSPMAKTYYDNNTDNIYVLSMANGGSDVITVDGSTNAHIVLQKYTIVSAPGDVSLNWSVSNLHTTLPNYNPLTNTHNHFGFISTSIESSVYTYHYDVVNNDITTAHIVINQIDRSSGSLNHTLTVQDLNLLPSALVNSIKIDKPSPTNSEMSILMNVDNMGILLTNTQFSFSQTVSLTTIQPISTTRTTKPTMSTYISSVGEMNSFVVYNTIDVQNKIRFADSITTAIVNVNTNLLDRTFSVPYRYAIDKSNRFNEVYAGLQTAVDYVLVNNPLNSNIFYIAYLTTTYAIRVVKIYRHKPSNRPNYDYLIMWATIADGTRSAFQLRTLGTSIFTNFVGDTTGNSLSMVTDKCGNVYVFARKDQKMYMWKIVELELDLGQNHVGITINSRPDVLPTLLANITDNYNVMSQESSLYLSHFPSVNDVIVSSVVKNTTTFDITFKYINYDIFQTPHITIDDKTLSQSFADELRDMFDILYGENNVSLVNFNPDTELIFEGTQKSILVKIPISNIVKPCILRGMEIIKYGLTGPEIVLIQNIKKGDMVLNQDANPVAVMSHTTDIICTNDWTTPYIIPTNYFGKDAPYSPLYISGDHGIRMNNRRIYAYKLHGAFKRLPLGTIVEYHHLKLECQDDFFMANGLLVESLRDGVYTT